MGGGGTKSSSKSYSGSGQLWATPYAKEGVGAVQGVFNQNQPGLQGLTDLTQKNLVPSLMGKFNSGLAGAGQAQGYYQDVLRNGGGANPYLDGVINSTNRGVTDSVNSQFANSGRYGSGQYAGLMTERLAEAGNNLRYQDYYNQTQRQDNAAGALTQNNQADLQQALAGIGLGAEIPYAGSNNLASSLGALFGGGTEQSKSKTKGPGVLNSLISAGATAAMFACDERLKENISLNRVEPDGLPVYDFTYRKDMGLPEGKFTMPMAQDVAAMRPWALGPEVGGYMTIYPDKL